MKRKLFSRKVEWSFQKETLKSYNKDLKNPGRGWYRIFTFDVEEPFPEEDWKWSLSKREQLVMLLVDIGQYSHRSITESALENINSAFEFFIKNEKELILRFTYDTEGEASLNEPSDVKRILEHMEQLAPVVNAHKNDIYCLQGLFVGNWGEMHGSEYVTDRILKKLWKHWDGLIAKDIFIAVRTPAQWRLLSGRKPDSKGRLALFNDGILGSETDLGTYKKDDTQKELDFQRRLCEFVPNGGEVIGGSKLSETDSAVDRLMYTRISYLNSVYDDSALSRWRMDKYKGMNAFDYIGMHLGYRFEITKISCSCKKEIEFSLNIVNSGFAKIYDECELRLVFIDTKKKSQEISLSADMREWEPQKKYKVSIKPGDSINLGEDTQYTVYLKAYRKKDNKNIYFANEINREAVFLGKLLRYIK